MCIQEPAKIHRLWLPTNGNTRLTITYRQCVVSVLLCLTGCFLGLQISHSLTDRQHRVLLSLELITWTHPLSYPESEPGPSRLSAFVLSLGHQLPFRLIGTIKQSLLSRDTHWPKVKQRLTISENISASLPMHLCSRCTFLYQIMNVQSNNFVFYLLLIIYYY